MSRRDFWMIALISSVFSSGLTLFILYWSAPPPASAVELTAPLPPPPDLSQEEQTNVEIYERVSPAVVNITSISMERNWFYEIIPRRGIGSGILIDKQGHVVTKLSCDRGGQASGSDPSTTRRLWRPRWLGSTGPMIWRFF